MEDKLEREIQEDFLRWAEKNSIVLSIKENAYEQLHEYLLRQLMAAG